jgi:spore maturation protein CgeB
MGSCLLTDYGRNIHDLFEPDTEIVMYRSVGEAIEKIGFLLENESAREAIAIAGQRKTLRSHTIWNRCQLINENLKARL